MRFLTFQSDKGDCVMLTSSDGHHMLVDGGMRTSYTNHVSRYLGRMRDRGETIDVVCVSHIDRDHVFGLLQLVDDLVEWRVYDYQVANGNSHYRAPDVHRPPEIGRFWHNAFHEQIGENSGPIADMLAAQSRILSASDSDKVREMASELGELAFSEGDAIQLSRRIGEGQLNIPLNPEYDGTLMFVTDDNDPLSVGSMSAWVIGPYEEDLRALRREWNEWLREKRDYVRGLQRRARRDEDRLGNDENRLLANRFQEQTSALLQLDAFQAVLEQSHGPLGRRERVTTPNLASLMLFVEDAGRTVLMTGDGHWEDILLGLEHAGKLRADGSLHVDILKVPHHGSEHNTSEEFAKRVTADTYVFCGNGAHENPDLRVVEAYIDSRIGSASKRSSNPEASNRFKLLFNCSDSSPELNSGERDHMRDLKRLVQRRRQRSGGKMRYTFMTSSVNEMTV